MAITQAMCTSFKAEILQGIHNLNSDVFKIALYSDSATLGAATTAYTASGEVSGPGYVAGGVTLTNVGVSSGTGAGFASFTNPIFPSVTITARGALIYNTSKANRGVVVLDFGENKTVAAGDFEIIMPAVDANSAVVRIA